MRLVVPRYQQEPAPPLVRDGNLRHGGQDEAVSAQPGPILIGNAAAFHPSPPRVRQLLAGSGTGSLYDVPRGCGPGTLAPRGGTGSAIAGVELPMTARWPLLFVLTLGLTATRAADPAVTIDTASPSGKVSPLFYGLMTEEINHSYDGGLYAELVRNRAFLDDAATPAHWAVVQGDGSAATIALDPKEPLN